MNSLDPSLPLSFAPFRFGAVLLVTFFFLFQDAQVSSSEKTDESDSDSGVDSLDSDTASQHSHSSSSTSTKGTGSENDQKEEFSDSSSGENCNNSCGTTLSSEAEIKKQEELTELEPFQEVEIESTEKANEK